MKYPIAQWTVPSAISAISSDISGAVALATGIDDFVYFAVAAKGVDTTNPLVTLGSAIPSMNPDQLDSLTNPSRNTSYNLIVGKLSPQGVLHWILLSPQLVTTSDEAAPSLVIGPTNELYVAYGTNGATFNNLNMADVPAFCANSCAGYGRQDVVLARINQLTGPMPVGIPGGLVGTPPAVAWVIQSARINSCNKETVAQLSIDRRNGLLYLAWQSNQNILCLPVVGAPNVLLSCFSLSGVQYWLEGGTMLNSPAINANPAIAADSAGGVTIAYETTGVVPGGTLTAGQRIEVIRFQTNLSTPTSYSRQWVLSGVSALFPDTPGALNTQPTILYDPTGVLCFAFLTNGAMRTTLHSETSVKDVVAVGLSLQGALLWVNQGGAYIEAPFLYTDCDAPLLTTDDYGNVFLSLLTIASAQQNVLVFRIHPADGCTTWQYVTPGPPPVIYGVYGYALTDAPHAVFPSQPLGTFTRVAVSMRSNALYVSAIRSGTAVCFTQLAQRNYFENLTPFQYESNSTPAPPPSCMPEVLSAAVAAVATVAAPTRRTKFRPGL